MGLPKGWLLQVRWTEGCLPARPGPAPCCAAVCAGWLRVLRKCGVECWAILTHSLPTLLPRLQVPLTVLLYVSAAKRIQGFVAAEAIKEAWEVVPSLPPAAAAGMRSCGSAALATSGGGQGAAGGAAAAAAAAAAGTLAATPGGPALSVTLSSGAAAAATAGECNSGGRGSDAPEQQQQQQPVPPPPAAAAAAAATAGGGSSPTGGGRPTLALDRQRRARAACGVRLMWVSVEVRRRGLASRLLDAARCHFVTGYVLPRHELAFRWVGRAWVGGGRSEHGGMLAARGPGLARAARCRRMLHTPCPQRVPPPPPPPLRAARPPRTAAPSSRSTPAAAGSWCTSEGSWSDALAGRPVEQAGGQLHAPRAADPPRVPRMECCCVRSHAGRRLQLSRSSEHGVLGGLVQALDACALRKRRIHKAASEGVNLSSSTSFEFTRKTRTSLQQPFQSSPQLPERWTRLGPPQARVLQVASTAEQARVQGSRLGHEAAPGRLAKKCWRSACVSPRRRCSQMGSAQHSLEQVYM